ncbi:MAG TPA: LOG family protein [Pirellulales bacterium]|nr:LOG family protein [Pirellulales bacterium]
MANADFPPADETPAADDEARSTDLVGSGSSERADRVSDLIAMIKESADKLAQDKTSRGDLKILSRTLRELRYAFKVFSPYRDRRKVTVFGSARTRPHEPPFEQAVAFGKAMADEHWLVVTGAASGIMEAGHLGAGRENSMGLNIMLPFEQEANPVIAGDPKLVHMKYFFTRKLMFVKECHAVCLLPGGFGTLDEGLEVLTLLQTGKRDMVPVVFLDQPGGSFWRDWDEFVRRRLLGGRLISPEDLSLYKLTDRVDVAVAETLQFYRVYHSMRYVRNKLVLRLQTAPSEQLLAEINAQFADILTEGQFQVGGPLPEEDEPELAHLSRLIFRFNRRNLGRLRQLIDCLNAGGASRQVVG